MSLVLDARQRAMLAEMGVRVFAPPAVAPAAAAEDAAVAPVRRPPARTEQDRVDRVVQGPPQVQEAVAARDGDVATAAGLDWDALQQAVAAFAAARRRKPVFGTGDLHARWLCIGEPPLEDEEHEGLPFAGDPGRLLDNMLAAVGASRRQGAYLTNVLKCRLPQDRADEAGEIAQSLAFLRRQVELLQPRVILAMGRFAVQALLQTAEPTGKLRGQVHRFHGVPVVVTFPPAYLLRTPADKARAWADLCLARAVVEAG